MLGFHLVPLACFSCLHFILFFNGTIFFSSSDTSFRQKFITHYLSASFSSSLETPVWTPSGPGVLLLSILSIWVMTFSAMISISYGSSDKSPRQKDYSTRVHSTFHSGWWCKKLICLLYICTFCECTFCSLIICWSYRVLLVSCPSWRKDLLLSFVACCMWSLCCVSISRAQPIWMIPYNIPNPTV